MNEQQRLEEEKKLQRSAQGCMTLIIIAMFLLILIILKLVL